jgi:hypothetical protein
MRRGSGALIAILVVAASLLGTQMWRRAARAAMLEISFSSLSLFLIVASAIVGIIGVLAWWYVPMGRRPYQVPMWNDTYHRRGPRAARAFSLAASSGVALAAVSLFAVTALLPNMNAPATRVISGGVVIEVSTQSWRCSGMLTLQDAGGRRYVCVCPRGACVRGYGDGIASGRRIDLEVSENWAGTAIVGLVRHGI